MKDLIIKKISKKILNLKIIKPRFNTDLILLEPIMQKELYKYLYLDNSFYISKKKRIQKQIF